MARGCGDAKQAANWVTQDVLREINERRLSIAEFPISSSLLAALLSRVTAKKLTIKSAREVFLDLLSGHEEGHTPSLERIEDIVVSKGLAIVQDDGAIEAAIAAVIERNPKAVADFQAGKQAAVGALIGQVMKQLKGADAADIRQRIVARLSNAS